jgi:hypothetical protein
MILRSNGRILDCDGIKRSKPYPSKRNSSSDLKTNAMTRWISTSRPEAPKLEKPLQQIVYPPS